MSFVFYMEDAAHPEVGQVQSRPVTLVGFLVVEGEFRLSSGSSSSRRVEEAPRRNFTGLRAKLRLPSDETPAPVGGNSTRTPRPGGQGLGSDDYFRSVNLTTGPRRPR